MKNPFLKNVFVNQKLGRNKYSLTEFISEHPVVMNIQNGTVRFKATEFS
jgi:hypothetical protein